MNFSIDASTFTLKHNYKDHENQILNRNVKYVIPIYQRPYSWTESQIQKFISDIFISFWGYNKSSHSEPMFIGTMQLSNIQNNEQDIIDGQQRISTFLILLKVLKLEYPNLKELESLTFDWLKTKVNSGKQQEKLMELINTTSLDNLTETGLNKYLENAILIRQIFLKNIKQRNEDDISFNPKSFLEYLYSNIYFVVIETNASLSKTLQIFDAINTTGLDLNAGDIFKIRMFEYLNKNGDNDSIFNEISKLYEKIDAKNKEVETRLTDIRGILNIYQFYLIAKYKLPTVLYSYGVDTFYDRLFETLFNINKWEHFKNNVEDNKIALSLEEINNIIYLRYEWEIKWRKNEYGNVKNKGLQYLWWWSRYSKFWIFKFVFLFIYKDDPIRYNKLYEFSEKLIKVYLLYSIVYQKSVNKIKGQFNNQLLDLLVNGNYSDLINHIDQKLLTGSDWEKNRFKEILTGDILYSSKVKNILCRLSALLEENYTSENPEEIRLITEKLFHLQIDIEHIQSYNDENLEERDRVKQTWGDNLNSLGNLVVLEQNINRSINNSENKKLENYKLSSYNIVNKILVDQYDNWNLNKCLLRKSYEISKICEYVIETKVTVPRRVGKGSTHPDNVSLTM
ncbi:DUF262 domain-containing protein [Arenibacter sp. 6A1]|uniref:DUF262 domain-containing protein n=1 Tax=Arenibacter sp. 6A1 TaxID=2720391 RepID=UPI00144790CC|nr:DUF262 domain-containing protein [Arenibacter sp. 6A1]NKI26500.1 DUF262 domain-containing protein [Arenibacter sp. 6A1]